MLWNGLIDNQDPEDGSGGGGDGIDTGGGGGGVDNPPPPPPAPGPVDPPPGPEPNPNPNPQGNPNPAPKGPPPSAIEGVAASDVTGGVQGSFGQAGTSNFSQRFGSQGPAAWFRNPGRRAEAGGAIAPDRGATTRGGAITSGALPPSVPESGGAPGRGGDDAEWQRFMQEVTRQRFGR